MNDPCEAELFDEIFEMFYYRTTKSTLTITKYKTEKENSGKPMRRISLPRKVRAAGLAPGRRGEAHF